MVKGKVILLLWAILFVHVFHCQAQTADTLQGFRQKIKGDELAYFSPLHEFSPMAMLSRTNGLMPFEWDAPLYDGNKNFVVYELLSGHSTGTSGGSRAFEISLNGKKLGSIETHMKQKGKFVLQGQGIDSFSYRFELQEYDLNNDAFGKLYLRVPATWVRTGARFELNGKDMNSRDWFMVFMYRKQLNIMAYPTQLVTRVENKRQLNFLIDNPYAHNSPLMLRARGQFYRFNLVQGYNKLSLPAYDVKDSGWDTLCFIVAKRDTVYKVIELKPVRAFEFMIVHHSHNDIGYSHLQTEVEQIQTENIRAALRWIDANSQSTVKPYWHIESLWAVENFMKVAKAEEKEKFLRMAKNGNLVLSANYANILTGLGKPQELSWALEYAAFLKKEYGLSTQNVMTTDIPGISWAGLKSYTDAGIAYLSMGPNYVGTLPDRGDRVGSVIHEQGDKAFYWKPTPESKEKILVWTAGKGYSYFHGITEESKQENWEKRLSDYCEELLAQNYPYDMIQLRYTKKSDNGPVDTNLCSFVAQWNERFLYPQLRIVSVNNLFASFEQKYGAQLPELSGEISPYWEDGAYSTAVEEMQIRSLVPRIFELEKFAREKNLYDTHQKLFYELHKNVVLFHEHTWGSWCSISDPELFFSTEQWRIKKAFADSALIYFDSLKKLCLYEELPASKAVVQKGLPTDFRVDPKHGGIQSFTVGNKELLDNELGYGLLEPLYMLGLNPMLEKRTEQVTITQKENNKKRKVVEVQYQLPGMPQIRVLYTLHKKEGVLSCRFVFDKQIEKNKEALHIALPFQMSEPLLSYGSNQHTLTYPQAQLPGSNKEFICVEEFLKLEQGGTHLQISCEPFALFEVGETVSENKINGNRVWRSKAGKPSTLYMYVFNNYWHTNYKAYQDGHFDFTIHIKVTQDILPKH